MTLPLPPGTCSALHSPAVNVPAPLTDLGVVTAPVQIDLAAYSINVIRLRPTSTRRVARSPVMTGADDGDQVRLDSSSC